MSSEHACDEEVYLKGEVVFITNTIASGKIEEWVKNLRQQSGQKVDWHWMGGRAVVRALGDIPAVRDAIVSQMARHDDLFNEATAKLGLRPGVVDPPRPDWWTEVHARTEV